MALIKKINLIVKDYSISLSSPISLFKNDNIILSFTINEYGIIVSNGASILKLMPITPLKAKLLIETPLGPDSIWNASVKDNEILFRVTDAQTKFVGVSRMQLFLYDDEGFKITLPEFQFEVKNTINEEFDGENILNPEILLEDDGSVILVDDNTAILEY